MDEYIERVVKDLGASSGAIMVVFEKDGVLRCGASYNMPQVWIDLVNPLENTPDKNTNGRVASTGIAEISNNCNQNFHGYPINSIIVVPVKANGNVVGNLEIISDSDKTFDVNDQKYLEDSTQELVSLIQYQFPPR